jgi:hypothetical protein
MCKWLEEKYNISFMEIASKIKSIAKKHPKNVLAFFEDLNLYIDELVITKNLKEDPYDLQDFFKHIHSMFFLIYSIGAIKANMKPNESFYLAVFQQFKENMGKHYLDPNQLGKIFYDNFKVMEFLNNPDKLINGLMNFIKVSMENF